MNQSRGFALLVAVVLTSVLLSVGLALLDISYKQVILSSTARQSQYAFYAADTAMECALYWDQKQNAFSYATPLSTIRCSATDMTLSTSVSGGTRTTTFSMPCVNGVSGSVTIYKTNGPVCSGTTATTCIYASGFNTCTVSDPRRIERGLKIFY
jgi:Tfp pilus assembly protein PilX